MPQDSGADVPWVLAVLAGVAAFMFGWVKHINPWPLFQKVVSSLNEPLMQKHFGPMRDDILEVKDGVKKLQRVVVHMAGGDEALAAVNQEDEAEKRWRNR